MTKTTPLNQSIIIYRDEEEDEKLYNTTLALPDSIKGRTQVAIVTDVGNKVRDLLPGDRVITKRIHGETPGASALGNSRYLIPAKLAYLKLVFGETEDGEFYRSYRPFGNRVLVKRLNRELKTQGGIIIPEHTDYVEQTPYSTVVEVGPDVEGLKRGDNVMHEWSSVIIEVGLGGGADDYYSVVPLEGIRFAFDCDVTEIDAEMNQPSENEIKARKKYCKKHKL